MQFNQFIRKPFKIEAIEITAENLSEIAPLIGEERTKGDDRYIAVDKRIVPSIHRAYVGWFVTRLDDNLRCYSPKVFHAQFAELTGEWADWLEALEDDSDISEDYVGEPAAFSPIATPVA